MMSGTTINGASLSNNWTLTSGATPVFDSYFSAGQVSAVLLDGVSTVTGSLAIMSGNGSDTVSGIAVTDQSGGGNAITSLSPSSIFAAPNDTISSAAASTVFGAATGVTHFAISGTNSSIVGGAGSTVGTASGANSTLVGGSGNSIFTVTGSGSEAVGGPGPGITGINESASTGPENIGTNPLGNSGNLVAFLGSGADTVTGGSGASTILGGSGSDVFAFVKGHAGGSEVVLNFTGSDTFAFGGYGYSATNTPVESLTTFDGIASDTITLSDNTTITLVGVTHKIF
jgi:serralysin